MKARYFAAAFAAVMIFFGAVCAFAAVDMSSDKYMPGHFGEMLSINAVDGGGMSITVAGEEYTFKLGAPTRAGDFLYRFRGSFPAGPRLVRRLTGIIGDAADRALSEAYGSFFE